MNGCGKVYHMSWKSASRHADTLENLCGTRPNVYKCKQCHQFHVGYDASKKLSKSARRSRTFHKRRQRKRETV